MKRSLWLGFVMFVYLICTGCGDTFRPIIIPNPPVFPNPKAAHSVVSINDNGTAAPGTAMVIDVSGDAAVSEANTGLVPVFAMQQTANQVLVANQSVNGAQADSLTKLTFNSVLISSSTVISLPVNSSPNFVAAAPSSTTAYVSLPNDVPPSVGIVNTLSNQVINFIPVGNDPDALVVTPDNTKLYVANFGDKTISGFNTVDRTSRGISPPNTTTPPIWLAARTDNQRVYVLEQNGGLDSIDTTSTAGPDPMAPSGISVPGATSMVYDINLNRLYIAGGSALTIVDVSQSLPQVIATVSIPTVASVPSVAASAVSVTALPDGSRAYVASVPSAAQPVQLSLSALQGDGTSATFTYTLTGGHNPTAGITLVVSGIPSPNDGFNGTYVVNSVSGRSCAAPQTCAFQVSSSTVLTQASITGSAESTIDELFPQVSVISVNSNVITSTFDLPAFPDATDTSSPYYVPVCASTRFRYNMASAGDSSRVYLASCDGGNINFIDTSNDTYFQNLPAPLSNRQPIPPSQFNPPQNPVFLFAGP